MRVAVDVARPARIQVIGDRRKHRLVEQGETGGDVPAPDQHAALAHDAESDQRGIIELLPQCVGSLGARLGGREVQCVERGLEAEDVVEVPALDAVWVIVEKACRAAQPP